MTTLEVQEKINSAGGSFDLFLDWMSGQTVGLYPNGETNWYDWDVDRFIRYKCNPKNEPFEDFD